MAGSAAAGSAVGRRLRSLSPLCSGAGLLLGMGLGVVGSGWWGQGAASAAAASFFLAVNCVPDEETSLAVLGTICSSLGCLLGYALGALLSQVRQGSSDGLTELAAASRLPLFFILCVLFHAVEFIFAVVCHPSDVSFRAFLLSPVPAGGYSIAMVAALMEYWVWYAMVGPSALPGALAHASLVVASVVAFGGWAFRTTALFTADSNFTHLVAFEKKEAHRLVSHGVYACVRHPGYLGWFLWSVGTQLVLGNPFCFVAYSAVSWRFFAGRIPVEEAMLVKFFGSQYLQYAQRVPCGLPYISRLDQEGGSRR